MSAFDYLYDWFPKLRSGHCQVTSPADDDYNCIAWAADNNNKWWWPDLLDQNYWPPGVPRIDTLSAFREMFSRLGYSECESDEFEDGWEKVAVYAKDDAPTHAARQIGPDRWTSKCGFDVDIEHELIGLEGTAYGEVALVLKRPNQILLFWFVYFWYLHAPFGPTKG